MGRDHALLGRDPGLRRPRGRGRTGLRALVRSLRGLISIFAQVGFLFAYPIWAAIIIGFDVLVIFALIVRWSEARAAM